MDFTLFWLLISFCKYAILLIGFLAMQCSPSSSLSLSLSRYLFPSVSVSLYLCLFFMPSSHSLKLSHSPFLSLFISRLFQSPPPSHIWHLTSPIFACFTHIYLDSQFIFNSQFMLDSQLILPLSSPP